MTKTKAAARPSGLPSALPSALPWYMAGQAFWFLSHGIQLVAFQAIGALVLELDATQLGLAQASLLIPALFLMLPAGVTAERNDGRIILLLLQGVAFFPPLVLGYMVLTGQLSFYGLVAYGLAMGVVGSFVMPARDALLSHIVGHDGIQRAVNMALGLQFTGMLTGMTIAALSEFIDVGWLPIIQAFIFIAASYAAFRLPRDLAQRPERAGSLPRRLPEMIDGLKMAFGHKDISPVLILQFGISIFYIGTFLVLLPILVRDYYYGDAADIAILNMLFWAGTLVSTIMLLRIGQIASVGRLLAGGISSGLVVIFLLSIEKPYWMLAVLCVVWGIAAGCSMSSGRTIIQNRAPDSHRARILSVYQLSFMGGAPFGALLTGILVDLVGVHQAPLFSVGGMGLTLLLILYFTRLWQIRLSEKEVDNVEKTTQL